LTERKKAEHELFKGTEDLEHAKVGDLIGVVEFVITREMVERTAWAMDDYNPWYLEESPFGGLIASPTAPLAYDGSMFYDYYRYPAGGSLFAKQEFEFIRPVMVGKKYTATGTLIDTYKKRGRTFFQMGVSLVDEDGIEVAKMAKTVATPVKAVLEEENPS
jgi:acyl dehydratase